MGILRSTGVPRAVSQADQPLRRLDLSYLLWCLSLVGICGVQRIYNRRPLSGVLYLLSFGLLGIGTVVDLFCMMHFCSLLHIFVVRQRESKIF